MIPVRVPVDAPIHTVGGIRTLSEGHWGTNVACPVCDGPFEGGSEFTLVFVGIAPDERIEGSRFTTGGAVMVHAACAGVEQ